MTVSVNLTGMLAASMGYKRKDIEVEDKITVKMLLVQLSLPINSEWLAVSVNGVLKDKWSKLKDGDDILISPAGGAG